MASPSSRAFWVASDSGGVASPKYGRPYGVSIMRRFVVSRSTVMAEVFKDCTAVKQEKGGYTYAYVKAMDSAKALPSANIHFQDADAMLTDMLTELAQGGDVAEILAKWQTQIQNEYNK